MKVCIVDDEYEKAAAITKVMRSVCGDELMVCHETTAASARLKMRTELFDMLLVDLNLPATLGGIATEEGGLDFFDMLMLDQQVQLPTDIMFITGREDLIAEAKSKVEDRGSMLCFYRTESLAWERTLAARARFIKKRKSLLQGHEQADIAVVAALREPELSAFLAFDLGWKQMNLENEPISIMRGTVESGGSRRSIVAASAFRMGMPSSAALATKIVHLFRPSYIMMIGICAGIPGKTNFGDIIVADPTWDWGSGKLTAEDGDSTFQAAPHQKALDARIRSRIMDLKDDPSVLRTIKANWPGDTPAGALAVHVGPMASGASVIADCSIVDRIKTQHRSILGVEMEAYAVMAAAEYSASPAPIALAIKSVCDFGGTEKNDDWQKYAAYTSAAFANKVIECLK